MPIDPPEPRDNDEDDTNHGVSTDAPAEGGDDVNPPGDGSPQG